ncbi:MAG: hypothetical protein VB131_02940 [Burkholderia gladioli]
MAASLRPEQNARPDDAAASTWGSRSEVLLGLGSWIGCPPGCVTFIEPAAQCGRHDGTVTTPRRPPRWSVIAGTAPGGRNWRDTGSNDGMRKVEAELENRRILACWVFVAMPRISGVTRIGKRMRCSITGRTRVSAAPG